MISRSGVLAKFSRPRLHEAVARERLFARLDEAASLPVTLVAAPPGAGKTTLVASYLENRQLPGIWFQVDTGDADLSTLFYFLGLAERALGTAPNQPPLPLFTPEYLGDVAGFSRRFFRDLFSRLPVPGTLVLDNFQEGGDDGALHEAVVAALEEVPPGVRVFLVSRHPPPDRYARLAANRRMALVDWQAMRLTAAEAQQVLQAAHLELDEEATSLLHERSGGWAAGLVLLAEQFRRVGSVPGSTDEDSLAQVFAYFAGLLFEYAPAAERETLMRLGYLPSMRESHAIALAGPQAPQLLDRLYRRNLFTDRRRGTEPVYAFHALFRAFLQRRAAEQMDLPARRDAQRQAAALLRAGGMPEEAMPLFLAAGEYDAAEAVIGAEASALIGQGRWKVVVDWIEALPAERLAANAWLQHWLGIARIGVDPAAARVALAAAHATAASRGDLACQMQCAAGIVQTYFLEYAIFTPMDPWITELERMFEPGFAFAAPDMELRAQSALLIAATYREPDHPRLVACAARVRELLAVSEDVHLRVSGGTFLTLYGTFTGRLDESTRAVSALVPLLSDPAVHIFPRVFGWAVIAWHCANTGDHALGAQAVSTLSAVARDEGFHLAERFACIMGFFYHLERGEPAQARQCIDRFERIMLPEQPYEAASVLNMKCYLGMLIDDPAYTLAAAPEALLEYERAGSLPHTVGSYNTYTWALAAGGDAAEARRIIAGHRRLSGRRNLAFARWGADAADAILALREHDETAVRRHLADIFGAERDLLDQYAHQLSWARGCSARLAAEALHRGIEPTRVRRFISTYRLKPPPGAGAYWPWPVRIHALGGFALWLEGERQDFGSKAPRRTLALLKTLVALGGRDVPDHLLVDALWGDEEGDVARDSFRVALHRLRRLLVQPDAVLAQHGRISLNPTLCWLDTQAFEEAAAALPAAPTPGQLAPVLALYRGELLAGEEEGALAAPVRQALAARFGALVARAAEACEQGAQWESAAELYLQGVQADPLAEGFYQSLMLCHLARGRHGEALAVHARLCDALRTTRGATPGPATEALRRKAAEGTQVTGQ